MIQEAVLKGIEEVIRKYQDHAEQELIARWNVWVGDSSTTEVHEVVGALLARQTTLATQFAGAPSTWNGHMAPLVIRSMVDAHISLSWIFQNPAERARKFIAYGLGQEKLSLEHLKVAVKERGGDPDKDPGVKARESWINSQRFTFLTEVDIGNWSGTDTRKMAEEAGCLELYRRSYSPYSFATHNMWNHVSKYNLRQCDNPLHRYHRIPSSPQMSFELEYMHGAANYLKRTFDAFDAHTKVVVSTESAVDVLVSGFEKIQQSIHADDKEPAKGSGGNCS